MHSKSLKLIQVVLVPTFALKIPPANGVLYNLFLVTSRFDVVIYRASDSHHQSWHDVTYWQGLYACQVQPLFWIQQLT